MKKTAYIIALVIFVAMLSGIASGADDAEFQKAVDLYKTGQYAEAARVLEKYVQQRPAGSAYYLLGYANYALGKEDEAAKNFKDAYLVDPEFSPGEFRRAIGIDSAVPPKSPPKPRVREAAPSAPAATVSPAVPAAPSPPAKKPAQAAPPPPSQPVAKAPPAPREEAPKQAPPAPRFKRPLPSAKPTVPTEFIVGLGLIPLALAIAFYLTYSICLFMIGKKTDTGASWLAFVPGVNFVWPLVGAANKSKLWIILTLVIPLVALYLWMLVAERFGKSKIIGLLFGLVILAVPIVNILFVRLVFKGAGIPSAKSRLNFPEIPDEFPPLPEVPGMEEEEASFEEAGPFEGTPPFEEALPEEEPFEEAPPEKEAEEEELAELLGEAEEAPEEFSEEEDKARGEDFAPLEEFPQEEEPPRPFEEAAPLEGAEPWALPEEEPLEYEALEEGEAFPGAAGAGLIGIGELFNRTFAVFSRRVLTLILITLLSYLLFGLGFGIFMGAGFALGLALPSMREGLVGGGVFAGVIAGLIASFWGYGAMVFGVADEKLGVMEAYRRAWQKVGSFIWLYILLFIIIIPGGLLLFLIPGILFIVWFAFAPFILAKEGVRGMSAVIKSKEYVRGFFGDVFLRFLPLFGILFVVWLIQWMLAFLSAAVPVAPQLLSVGLSLIITPFIMIYLYQIYESLRGIKGDVAYSPTGGQKAKWLGLGCLGWILVPIIFLLFAGVAILGSFMMYKAQF